MDNQALAQALAPLLSAAVDQVARQVLAGLGPELARQRAQEPAPTGPATIAEAAELLGCHDSTIRRMIRDGRLRATRTGSSGSARVLISRADLDELMGGAR